MNITIKKSGCKQDGCALLRHHITASVASVTSFPVTWSRLSVKAG
jgi:hypothetical protein